MQILYSLKVWFRGYEKVESRRFERVFGDMDGVTIHQVQSEPDKGYVLMEGIPSRDVAEALGEKIHGKLSRMRLNPIGGFDLDPRRRYDVRVFFDPRDVPVKEIRESLDASGSGLFILAVQQGGAVVTSSGRYNREKVRDLTNLAIQQLNAVGCTPTQALRPVA